MRLREPVVHPRTALIIKASAVGVLLIVALVIAVPRVKTVTASGEEGLQAWFYDQSEQRLYAVARDTVPPHQGIGGAAGDGVRAVVVACRTETDDPAKRRIAYLEMYAPELKRILEDVRAARDAGRQYNGQVPARDGEFFQKNTLVRRPTESDWHDMTGDEAGKIIAEWRSWPCPDGSAPVVCTP
jgi:hypothetical protein